MSEKKEQFKLRIKYFAKVFLKTKNKNLIIFKKALLKYRLCIKELHIYIYSFRTRGFSTSSNHLRSKLTLLVIVYIY